jgi:hypothetical protein
MAGFIGHHVRSIDEMQENIDGLPILRAIKGSMIND